MSKYYGILFIIILIGVSGAIAYIGDLVGRRMGRRRLSLFGLRPRHTAIVISVVSGMLITIVTLGLAMALNENVRIGFISVGQLRDETRSLRTQRGQLAKGVATLQKTLASTKTELTGALKATEEDLKREQGKLKLAQESRVRAEDAALRQLKEVKRLELQATVMRGKTSFSEYTAEVVARRANYQQVIFSANQPLDIVLVDPSKGAPAIRKQLDGFIAHLDEAVRKAGAKPEKPKGQALLVAQAYVGDPKTGDAGWLPANQVLDGLAKSIAKSPAPDGVIVQAMCRRNTPPGEPVWVHFLIFRNDLAFSKGTPLGSLEIKAGTSQADTYAWILHLLRDQVGPKGQGKVMPLMNPSSPQSYNPAKSAVGELSPTELFDAIAEVQKIQGAARVTALTKEDTWTAGPLRVDLRVEPVR